MSGPKSDLLFFRLPLATKFLAISILVLILQFGFVNAATTGTKTISITLSSTPNPAVYGQSVNFTITLSSAVPSGETISLYDGANVLVTKNTTSSSILYIATSALGAGSHAITVKYPGDATYKPGTSGVITQTITKSPTSIALSSSPNPSTSGQSVAITASVLANIPNGETITFKDSGLNIGTATSSSGSATLSLSSLIVGTHLITATYPGDGNFITSTSNTLTQNVKAIQVNTTTTINQPQACQLVLGLNASTQYFVAPQPIALYYTVSKSGPCASIPKATGTLSISSSATGVQYASVPINITGVTSVPLTRVAYINSTNATSGLSLAVLTLSAPGVSTGTATTSFYVLQPANLTIRQLSLSKNMTQVGSPVQVITNLLNNAFFGAYNATLNIEIVAPDLSTYKITQPIGKVAAFKNLTLISNLGQGAIPQLQGKYLVVANVSFYSNFSTPGLAYASNALISNTNTTTFVAYLQNNGYQSIASYPSQTGNIGQIVVSSAPYYTDILATNGLTIPLSALKLYNTGTLSENISITVPQLPFGNLLALPNSPSLQPNQVATINLAFTPIGLNSIGTFVIPINVTATTPSGISTTNSIYTIININQKSKSLQLLENLTFFNMSKNLSAKFSLQNHLNKTAYGLLFYSTQNSTLPLQSNLLLTSQSIGVRLGQGRYRANWTVGHIDSNSSAQFAYVVKNVSQKGVILPSTMLSYSTQSNLSTFSIIGISKPSTIYTNATITVSVSGIYTGTNVTTIALSLTAPLGANVLNPQQTFKVSPNSAIDARFTVVTGLSAGNESFKLTTPSAFGPQSQFIELYVQPKPITNTLLTYLSDPRTLFGAASFVVYVSILVYGRVTKTLRERKLKARSTVKNISQARQIDKKIFTVVIEDASTKRTFRRHENIDNSLGGFVEESAIVGKEVIVGPNAIVENDAIVSGNVKVLDNATISNHAIIRGKATISGNSRIGDDAEVYGNAKIYGEAKIFGNCEVYDNAKIYANAQVLGNARVYGEAEVDGSSMVFGNAEVSGDAHLKAAKVGKGSIVSGTH